MLYTLIPSKNGTLFFSMLTVWTDITDSFHAHNEKQGMAVKNLG